MSKITYTNKVTLNDYPDIANINKCTAGDLNEIKAVVNENDDNVGDLTNLNTTTKTDIVSAINEVNTALNTVSIAKLRTNGQKIIENGNPQIIRGIWTNEFQFGDYTCDIENDRIIVRNTEVLEITGATGGTGPAWNRIAVRDDNDDDVEIGNANSVLCTETGYWFFSFPVSYYKLDKTKTYYVYLYCAGYNDTFKLNSGIGDKGTVISARKVK